MLKKKTVFVLIDALRSDYINNDDSPFLFRFSRENTYYQRVVQSRSFCERSEIFTGLSPRESGYFTAIGFDPQNSPFKDLWVLSCFTWLDSLLIKNLIYRKLRNIILRFLTRKKNVKMSAYSIPAKFLPFFSLTEDEYDFRDKKAFKGKQNLFKDCELKGLKVYYESFTALNFAKFHSDEDRLVLVEENIDSDFDFFLIYVGVMDSCAHKYGPNSDERRKELKRLDLRLSQFHEKIVEKYSNVGFVFLGDHGMSNVNIKLDVANIVEKVALENHLKKGEDFVYFLDSTMFRVWFLNSRTASVLDKRLKSNLNLLNAGVFVDDRFALKERIPFPDKRYGDLLWLANEGVLIYPDFFHTVKPYKGMHGYDINSPASKGTCMVSSTRSEILDEIRLTDLYRILKKELSIQ